MNLISDSSELTLASLPHFASCLLIGFLAIVLFTIDIIIRQMESLSPKAMPRIWVSCVRAIRVLVCMCMIGLAMYVMFNPLGVLVIVLGTSMYLSSIFARRRDETESVNALIRMVSDHGGTIPEAVESFARSCRSVVRRRTRDFSFWLRCGAEVDRAARLSGLSLMPDTVVATRLAGGSATDRMHEDEGVDGILGQRSLTSEVRWLSWPVSGQLLYMLSLIVMSMLLVTFLNLFILPTLEKIEQDFSFGDLTRRGWVRNFYWYWPTAATSILIISVIWLGLVVITSLRPTRFWTRITPWFGNWMRQSGRWTGLRSLAGGLRRGETLASVLESATKSTRSRWIRMRSRDALHRLHRGESTSGALCQSGWVSRSESRWLQSAEANQSLPTALAHLSSQIRRRYDMVWQLRLAWLVPLVTILVALVVLAQAIMLFGFLTELTHGLA